MEKIEFQLQSLPNLPLFLPFFLSIYVFAYFVVFRNWSPKTRPEAASCAISLFHGTPAVILASRAILSDDHRGFAAANTEAQAAVLDFSVAYFLADLVHYLVFYPSDVLFIGHHLATLFVFLTCRFAVARGAHAILSLLVLAEVTSACQNAWTLAGARRGDSELAARLYGALSPPFYAFYSFVRGCLGPWFAYKMLRFYVSGDPDNVIPTWVWVSWIFVVVTAISVSILWVTNLWVELYRERRGKLDNKLKMR